MSVDRVSDAKTGWGPPWLPLLIQIYIPTRNTFLPYILHHTTQLLLACHSKINIFTKENKGINNLWGNHRSAPLRSLLLPCHCTSQSSTTAFRAQALQAVCLTLDATRLSLWRWAAAARKHLEAYPTLILGLDLTLTSPLPSWDIT